MTKEGISARRKATEKQKNKIQSTCKYSALLKVQPQLPRARETAAATSILAAEHGATQYRKKLCGLCTARRAVHPQLTYRQSSGNPSCSSASWAA